VRAGREDSARVQHWVIEFELYVMPGRLKKEGP